MFFLPSCDVWEGQRLGLTVQFLFIYFAMFVFVPVPWWIAQWNMNMKSQEGCLPQHQVALGGEGLKVVCSLPWAKGGTFQSKEEKCPYLVFSRWSYHSQSLCLSLSLPQNDQHGWFVIMGLSCVQASKVWTSSSLRDVTLHSMSPVSTCTCICCSEWGIWRERWSDCSSTTEKENRGGRRLY